MLNVDTIADLGDAPLPLPAAPEPDRVMPELRPVCERLIAVMAERDALYEVRRERGEDGSTEPQMDAVYDERNRLMMQIMALPIVTLAEARIVARAAYATAAKDADRLVKTTATGDCLMAHLIECLADQPRDTVESEPMKRTQSPLPAAHDLTGHAGGDILAIGRCIHMLDEQHNAADELCVRLKQGPQYDAAGEEMNRLFDVMRDMENGALQRRAATIGDIAVQAAICHGVADTFDACILTDQQRHERAALIRRAMASIVLCASRIAGIPADSIARMQAVDLRREFPGAEV